MVLTASITFTPRMFTMFTNTTVTSWDVTTFFTVCFEAGDLLLLLLLLVVTDRQAVVWIIIVVVVQIVVIVVVQIVVIIWIIVSFRLLLFMYDSCVVVVWLFLGCGIIVDRIERYTGIGFMIVVIIENN
jgi:hypothetical protein